MDLGDRVTYPPQTNGGVDHNRDGHPQQIHQNSVGHEKWSSPEVIQKSKLALRKEMNWRGDPICTGIPPAKGHALFENISCRPATIVEATGDVVNACP